MMGAVDLYMSRITNKKRYSVSRAGMGGRPSGEHPNRPIKIACDDQEFLDIQTLSPRERATVLIEHLRRESAGMVDVIGTLRPMESDD